MSSNKVFKIVSSATMGIAILASSVSAQWTRNGTSGATYTTNSGDRVGIGIAAPLVKLDVRGGQAMFGPAAGLPGVATIRPSGNGAWWNLGNTHNGTKFMITHGDQRAANDNTSWNSALLTIQSNGMVGIGNASPLTKLDVRGGQVMFGPAAGLPGVATILPSGNGSWWNIGNTHNGSKFIIGQGDLRSSNDNTSWNGGYLTIQSNGFVGIGTINPQSRLAVNGTVTAKSLIVTTSGWADYVFQKDYELRPLDNVKAFIEKEGHLPGIPKADEVAKTGVDVGEMQVKLLEKIEELTLYLIDQESKIVALAAQNAELKTLITKVK